MQKFELHIRDSIIKGSEELFGQLIDADKLVFQPTRKEFEGDVTLVVFGLSKMTKKSPENIGKEIGDFLLKNARLVESFNVVKGFLNLVISDEEWIKFLNAQNQIRNSGYRVKGGSAGDGKKVLVEFSSPNTNKPLHLGHIRNILLGNSVSQLIRFTGSDVVNVNIVNDRGIHICKSMLAWKNSERKETPSSSGIKGDHLVGNYYVEFEKNYRREIQDLIENGSSRDDAEKSAPSLKAAQDLLRKWEKGDQETVDLWREMNGWVYEGFDITYEKLGVHFDKIYYESDTYVLGKKVVEEGLQKDIFFQKPDGSVWVDLTEEGLDNKLLLRADGTSVYITQDIGTAIKRFEDYQFDQMVYVVGNEQDYHFKVLFLILKKLGHEWADRLYHLSYNMVDLPSGKMKSREGTVVDADHLISDMEAEAEKISRELGKIEDFDSDEAKKLYECLGLGALKYYILKVDPEKRMLFNPEESIDFNGNTGPFIQYTHARISSVLRKSEHVYQSDFKNEEGTDYNRELDEREKMLIKLLCQAPEIIKEAAAKLSPAIIANYLFDVARTYNKFYHDLAIIDSSDSITSKFRLHISAVTSSVMRSMGEILGITMPSRM